MTKLEAMQKRLDAATKGPFYLTNPPGLSTTHVRRKQSPRFVAEMRERNDAELFAHSREDMELLLKLAKACVNIRGTERVHAEAVAEIELLTSQLLSEEP